MTSGHATLAPVESESTTRISPRPTFTHRWKVEGLRLEDVLRASTSTNFDSPVFEALGAKWFLRITPKDPVKDGKEARVGCHLHIEEGASPPVVCSMQFGSALQVIRTSRVTRVFINQRGLHTHESVSSIGWHITHAKLTADPGAYFTPEGVFKLVVTLTDASLTAVQSSVETLAATAPVPPPTLASELRQLLAGTRGSSPDVQLLCSDGQLVPAHSFVLGLRSGVFAAQLSADGPLAPVDRDRVPVPPEITAGTLRRLLEFVYTDELTPASAEKAQHLLNAADHYALPRLLAICERTLEQQLSVDNAAFTLTLAAQHRARALERAAVFFAARRIAAVMRTDGWAHLSAARPLLKDKLLLVAATGELPLDEEEQAGQGGGTAEEGGAAGGSARAGGSGGEGEGARSSKRPRIG